MNPEQQRIAIAEACGWKLKSNGLSPMWSWQNESLIHRIKWVAHKVMASHGVLPDYLNDLNAMHDAEKVLTEDQQEQYLNNLYEVCNLHSMINDAWNLNCATAAQRAEAFLRTIGKWEESK